VANRQQVEHRELLDPDALSSLGRLELIATRIVEGFVSGKHRSPFKGGCVEFAEHRSYSPGDEIRLLDWRVFGRSDRYYIKQFEEETNLQVQLVLDASGSMGFGLSTVSKFRYAQMASACLTRLLLHQRDAVGLTILDTKLREYIPPRSKATHFHVILEALARTQTGGETSLAGVLHELAARIRRRGMLVVCSDCFDDVEALLHALHHLRSRGHEVLLFHIMAPEELSFSFKRWTHFVCLEGGPRIDLDPPTIRKRYLERVEAFLDRLGRGCGEIECEYVPLTTERPIGEALSHYLGRRAARMKVRG
jgi:uncharacterized protein (DUF58 family)